MAQAMNIFDHWHCDEHISEIKLKSCYIYIHKVAISGGTKGDILLDVEHSV